MGHIKNCDTGVFTRNVLWNAGEHIVAIGKARCTNIEYSHNLIVGPFREAGGHSKEEGYQVETVRIDGDLASQSLPIDGVFVLHNTSYGGLGITVQGWVTNLVIKNNIIDGASGGKYPYLFQDADKGPPAGLVANYNAYIGDSDTVVVRDNKQTSGQRKYSFRGPNEGVLPSWMIQTTDPALLQDPNSLGPNDIPGNGKTGQFGEIFVNATSTKTLDPNFPHRQRPNGNFRLAEGSPFLGVGENGVNLGVIPAGVSGIPVAIDIKPGSFPNSINLKSKGLIAVAILTTSTAQGEPLDFGATTVDAISVQFGPNGAIEAHGVRHLEDVDGDGDLDLVLHFRTQETGISCGDTSASLTGQTFGGQAIQGSDYH